MTSQDKQFVCVECGLELPINVKSENKAKARIYCAFCGAVYSGSIDDEAPEELRQNVRVESN